MSGVHVSHFFWRLWACAISNKHFRMTNTDQHLRVTVLSGFMEYPVLGAVGRTRALTGTDSNRFNG